MGQLFGQGLTVPGSAITDPNTGQTSIGKPSDVLGATAPAIANRANQQETSNIFGNQDQAKGLPSIGTPSFPQAAQAGAMPGSANILSPGLNKAGKLATLLTTGLQGAMAGRAKSEETVAATGGRRSGGAGMGFEAGYTLPWQRAGMENQLAQQQAQTNVLKSEGQTVDIPGIGPMPGWLAKALGPAGIRAQASKDVQGMKSDTAETDTNKIVEGRKDVANIIAGAKPAHTITVGNQTLQWNPATKSYDTAVGTGNAGQAKMGSVKPEVYAQLGAPPMNDPEKLKAWGVAAEAITNRMAASGAAARGAAYGAYRPVQVIDPDTGNVAWQYAKNAIGDAPAGPGAKAMSQQAQFKDIETGSQSVRKSIQNLDRDFTDEQRAKLIFAMDQPDPGLIHNMSDAMLGTEQLTDKQKEFVIWATQLQERALSLRSVAGMGQGSEQLRAAIQATLPGIRSANKEYALKQLDAFDQQVAALKPGIPGVKRNQTNQPGSQNVIHYKIVNGQLVAQPVAQQAAR